MPDQARTAYAYEYRRSMMRSIACRISGASAWSPSIPTRSSSLHRQCAILTKTCSPMTPRSYRVAQLRPFNHLLRTFRHGRTHCARAASSASSHCSSDGLAMATQKRNRFNAARKLLHALSVDQSGEPTVAIATECVLQDPSGAADCDKCGPTRTVDSGCRQGTRPSSGVTNSGPIMSTARLASS